MKQIVSIARPPEPHWVGDGFPVRSVINPNMEGVSPFLLLDYGGPMEFSPADVPRGVDSHPHRGFETVTLVWQGSVDHRDSSGNKGSIGPGDVQWMTAASGVVHEEKHGAEFTRNGGIFEVAQLWVNLPAKDKMSQPKYQELLKSSIPVVDLHGGTARIVAGKFGDTVGPAKTFTPINVWDIDLEDGGKSTLPAPGGHNAVIFVAHGKLMVGDEEIANGEVATFDMEGDGIEIEAVAGTKALVLTGEPIDEPVVAHGPFVMNSFEEIRQAVYDYQSGKMGVLD
jgi:redox-sensitive bicupin YhaK (pirin superfamily)